MIFREVLVKKDSAGIFPDSVSNTLRKSHDLERVKWLEPLFFSP